MEQNNSRPAENLLPLVAPGNGDWREMPIPDRIGSISKLYLYHPVVSEMLERLTHAFHASRSGPGMGILIYGPQNTGVASLVRHFARQHPMQERKPVAFQPVIVSTPTSNLTSAGLAESIACDAGWPTLIRSMGNKIPELQVDNLLRQSGTQMLFLVRASLLANGRSRIAPESVPFILNLLDRGAATIALAGEDDLPTLVAKCPSLSGRFFDRMPLNALAMDEHWRTMIRTLSQLLPFEETELDQHDMPERLHNATGGKPPPLLRLTEAAARVAYYGHKSKILRIEHYKTAFGYAHPGETNPFVLTVAASRLRTREAEAGENAKRDALRIANRGAAKLDLSNLM